MRVIDDTVETIAVPGKKYILQDGYRTCDVFSCVCQDSSPAPIVLVDSLRGEVGTRKTIVRTNVDMVCWTHKNIALEGSVVCKIVGKVSRPERSVEPEGWYHS